MASNVTILGSTGSIGESALRVMRSLDGEFGLYGLACRKNIDLLDGQIAEFDPAVVAVESGDAGTAEKTAMLARKYPGVEFLQGAEGVIELARRKTDVVISAIVGAAGLRPTVAAVGAAGRIALANKETLVMAGELFMKMVEGSSTELIPVDSEHSAIFSLLNGKPLEDIERIIITASGGGLRDVDIDGLSDVTPEMALKHPTWDMGSKITIDSATLMNKGLEVIEAHHLFGIGYERISVIIHPESVIHSMVETVDGSLFAHMGVADMALPILGALKFPLRARNSFGRLNLEEIASLSFREVDPRRYPALDLCCSAGKDGGSMPAVLNASNEVAVGAFLAGKISFTDIVTIVEKVLSYDWDGGSPGLDDIVDADHEARIKSEEYIKEVVK